MQAKEKTEKPLKWFVLPNESYKWDFVLEKYFVESQQSGEYVDFLEALRRAEAEAVVSSVEVITIAAQGGDWRAAAWFLEHKYPNNWARLEKRAVEGSIPDTNRDVVQKRVEEYWAEVERRRMAFPENTDKLITELQGRGYEVYEKKED